MKTLKIEIDCGEKTCGECHLESYVDTFGFCLMFDVGLGRDAAFNTLRCPACLDAEDEER